MRQIWGCREWRDATKINNPLLKSGIVVWRWPVRFLCEWRSFWETWCECGLGWETSTPGGELKRREQVDARLFCVVWKLWTYVHHRLHQWVIRCQWCRKIKPCLVSHRCTRCWITQRRRSRMWPFPGYGAFGQTSNTKPMTWGLSQEDPRTAVLGKRPSRKTRRSTIRWSSASHCWVCQLRVTVRSPTYLLSIYTTKQAHIPTTRTCGFRRCPRGELVGMLEVTAGLGTCLTLWQAFRDPVGWTSRGAHRLNDANGPHDACQRASHWHLRALHDQDQQARKVQSSRTEIKAHDFDFGQFGHSHREARDGSIFLWRWLHIHTVSSRAPTKAQVLMWSTIAWSIQGAMSFLQCLWSLRTSLEPWRSKQRFSERIYNQFADTFHHMKSKVPIVVHAAENWCQTLPKTGQALQVQ